MDYLYCNTIEPQLTEEEIAVFLSTPDPVDEVPELFKDVVMFRREEVPNLTDVPRGLTKTEYNKLLTLTRSVIQETKNEVRMYRNKCDDITADFVQCRLDDLIVRENTIKKRIGSIGKKYDGTRLYQAKQVPIENLIEVRGGFARCPLHTDNHPSMKVYANQNRWHCFSCGRGGDTVDLIQAIHGIPMPDAIKLLVGA